MTESDWLTCTDPHAMLRFMEKGIITLADDPMFSEEPDRIRQYVTRLDRSFLALSVTASANSIYDQRIFDQMPALAELLEAGGCTTKEVLEHCRGPRTHVRGCWVVDLILGKE
jgi:hypothetical protein